MWSEAPPLRAGKGNMNMSAAPKIESEVPFVSAVVGDGNDAHRLVHVGAWELRAMVADNEPRIRDLDLGRQGGLGRARDVRKLIDRLVESGYLPGIQTRATVARVARRGRGEVEIASTEYWLTLEEALFVVTRMDTPKAVVMTKEMIRVFISARHGLAPSAQAQPVSTVTPETLLEFGKLMVAGIVDVIDRRAATTELLIKQYVDTALDKRFAAIPAAVTNNNGTIGAKLAKQIVTEPLRRFVVLSDPKKQRRNAVWSAAYRELRGRLDGFEGSFAILPEALKGVATVAIADMVKRAEREMRWGAEAAQSPLPFGNPPKGEA
jgi:hypothetical protein